MLVKKMIKKCAPVVEHMNNLALFFADEDG